MKLRNVVAAAGLALASAAALATPSVQFLIDGDTFTNSFRITNLSSANETITGMTVDLLSGFVFNTVDTSTTNQGRAFTYSSNSATFDLVAGSVAPADQGTGMSLGFANFFGQPQGGATSRCGALCYFQWNVDVDAASASSSGTDLQVFGNNLIGSSISVTFSDGTTLRGLFGAIANNADAAGWSATGTTQPPPNGTPEPGSLALAGLALLGLGVARRVKRA